MAQTGSGPANAKTNNRDRIMTQQECSGGSDTQDPERLKGFSEQQHLLEQISRKLDEYFAMKLSLRTDNRERR